MGGSQTPQITLSSPSWLRASSRNDSAHSWESLRNDRRIRRNPIAADGHTNETVVSRRQRTCSCLVKNTVAVRIYRISFRNVHDVNIDGSCLTFNIRPRRFLNLRYDFSLLTDRKCLCAALTILPHTRENSVVFFPDPKTTRSLL